MSLFPPTLAAEVAPPEADPLGVLSGTAPVARDGQQVRIEGVALDAVARRWAGSPWPEQAGLDALHVREGTWRTANWILLLDALNFCFWGTPDGTRWRVEWQGELYDGYRALAAALSRGLAEGHPLWEAEYLARLDAKTLGAILRPAAGHPPIPLFAERLTNAREVGELLLTRFGGSFVTAVESVGRDAVALVRLLAETFPSFGDRSEWAGRPVPFYKRAQICVADLSATFDGEGIGALTQLAALTAFADYKLPQLLRAWGVLTYADDLAYQVDHYEPIAAGSPPEAQIRAATIWAVELLRRRLARQGARRRASEIDYRLWTESQDPGATPQPYHRTRTIYY